MYEKIRRYLVLRRSLEFPIERHFRQAPVFLGIAKDRSARMQELQDQCMLHASSLTYYTILAIVPVLRNVVCHR